MRSEGDKGEQIAADYLLSQGYKIIERNFYTRSGEIDIVASDGEVLAFVEVKYYKQNSLRDLHEAVDRAKQRKMIKTAQVYMARHNIQGRYTRFDVVLISASETNEVAAIELFKDAFRYN